jgi:FkbM family methyltransferase
MKAIVYGAGTMGAEVANLVAARGYRVVGVLDDKIGDGQRVVAGQSVTTTSTWLNRHDPAEVEAFIAIHNPFASVAAIEARLGSLGFTRCVNPVQLYRRFPGALPDKYWLCSPRDPATWRDAAAEGRALLADETSRRIFDATLRLRETGDYACLPVPTPEDQYLPNDLPPLPRRLAVVDCGAYVGDTLQSLVAGGYELTNVLAFEPDPQNYRQLVRDWGHLPTVVFAPCGVSERTEFASFATGSGAASGLRDDGTVLCQCVALDEFAPGFSAQLIKMDVEGAEPASLRGARRLIARRCPRLAISVYHHHDHLWEIARMIAGWSIDYHFYLRSHAFNTFDTVLYAVPSSAAQA